MVNISNGVDNLSELKEAVFSKQKILAKLYTESAQKSLFEYVNGWPVSLPSENTGIFFGWVKKLLLRIYPAEFAEEVLKDAVQNPLVSTIDHHGILNHPFFVNSNLIYSQRENIKCLLCFSTAGVSLNNSSWPGCLLVTGQDGRPRRFSFFPDKIKNQAVLGARAISLSDVETVIGHIKSADFLNQENKSRLFGLVDEIFSRQEIFGFGDFSAQSSLVSGLLWNKIFPHAPVLVYLPLEELVSTIIIGEIAGDKNNILHKLFFTQKGWDSVEKYFQGSLGGFSGKHKGSFLFWGLKNGRRAHLARQGQVLADYDFSVPPDAEKIVGMLEAKQLYPTTLMCFLTLLYYGLTCLGGFNQVNWLTDTKEKFIGLLKEWGEEGFAEKIAKIPTENFAEGSLAFAVNGQGGIYKPTGLDLFLQNDPNIYERYRQLALKITLGESIDAQLPEIYKVITSFKDRNNKLLDITESNILNFNGMADKIKAVLKG